MILVIISYYRSILKRIEVLKAKIYNVNYKTMKVLIFDTETSGLPTERNSSIYRTFTWPYIVQLSYIVYDSERNVLIGLEDDYINIDNSVVMDPESVKIHNITKSQLEKGINIVEALQKFNNYARSCDKIVGHNVSFDKRMIMVEGIRNNIQMNVKNTYCTMKNSTEICKIERTWPNGDKYFKYPKLSELYIHLFNEEPKNTHNALVDILICMRCYCKIELNIDIMKKNNIIKTMLIKSFE
jgi:DNA polymerase III epsilon subunit-like protein